MEKEDETKDKERKEKNEIRLRLRAETWHEIQPIVLGTAAMLASSLSNQALPRLMGKLIDQKSGAAPNSTLTSSLGFVVLGGGLASFVRTTMLNRAESGIATRLRKQAFQSLLTDKDLEWFQAEKANEHSEENASIEDEEKEGTGISPGAIGAILSEDVKKVSSSLTTTIANIIRSSSAVLFSAYHMLTLDPGLFGVSVTVVPLVGMAAMVLRKSIKRITEQQLELATSAASFVEERLTHISMVKMSNREVDEVNRYSELQDESLRLARRGSLQNGIFMGFTFAASSGALLLVVNTGGKSVAAGRMTSGQLTSFATYSFLLGLGTSGVVKGLSEFMQGMVSAGRLYRLIERKEVETEASEVDEARTSVDVDSIQSIAFRDVCFSYKSTGAEVLHRASFELNRGEVVAMVGQNGSGKSTITSLLAGLYLPGSGRIVLSDNTDFTKLNKTSKKNLVQVVPQSTALFNMSILENVRYSNPDASEDDVRRALKMANCEGFVSKLEGGMHFIIGLNGSRLSGGERQRLALARALLSDPAILIMDEPATSLDAEGESAVADALVACREGSTGGSGRALLLITHQAKSLKYADIVLVLKNGAVIEAGQVDDLCSNPNSELCRLMPDLS